MRGLTRRHTSIRRYTQIMEGIKDDCGEMNKELENIKEQVYDINNKEESLTKQATSSIMIEQEIGQLATTEVTRDIRGTETEPQESDTPVEENEEGMLPEDGVLLTYILKRSQEDIEIKVVDSPTKPETKAADSVVDILMPGDNLKISENSQKSCEMKKVVEDIIVVPSMSQPVMGNEEILEEEPMESQTVMMTMVEKLTKVVNNLGFDVENSSSAGQMWFIPREQYCQYS